MWTRVIALGVLSVLLSSCQTPAAEVRRGLAASIPPERLLVVPASCGSVEDLCDDAFLAGVTTLVHSELEFAGYAIVDAEKIALEARTDEQAEKPVRMFGERVLRAANRRQVGEIFNDMTPAGRAALLSRAAATATVTVRISISAPEGVLSLREHQVLIRIGKGADDDLVWVSRCSEYAGMFPAIEDAVDDASRCALAGVFP